MVELGSEDLLVLLLASSTIFKEVRRPLSQGLLPGMDLARVVIMAETAGDEWADYVKFAGGKSIVGAYEPNIFVLSIAVPRGTGLEELVDEEIRQIRV